MRIATVVALAVSAGCASHGERVPPPGSSSSDVVGTFITTCHQTTGDVDLAFDASNEVIQAFVPDAGPSGYRVVSSSGGSDGSFVLHDVPEGAAFVLQTGALATFDLRYFVTDQRMLTLRSERQGRCNPSPARASAPIGVAIDLTSTTGFSDQADRMELDSFELGFATATATAVSGTSDLQASIPWPKGSLLPDAVAGDDLYVLHTRLDQGLDPATDRPVLKRHILEWFDATGTTLVDGQPAAITGAFSTTASPHTGTLSIDHARFEALYDHTSVPGDFSVQLLTQPGAGGGIAVAGAGGAFSSSLGSAVLLDISVGAFEDASIGRSTMTGYSYADPFPASWHRWVAIDYARFHLVRLSSDPSAPIGIGTGYHQQLEFPGAFQVAPALTPPAAITIGGVDFGLGGKVAFDGQSPIEIRWAPVPGAQLYELTMARATDNARQLATATVTTADTTLRLPAALLDAAVPYQFTLTAIQTPTDYRGGDLVPVRLPQVAAGVPSGRFRFLPSCGDGVVQAGEDCDTSGESATCNADCTAATCGDGVVNAAAGEQCDAINQSLSCTPACKLP